MARPFAPKQNLDDYWKLKPVPDTGSVEKLARNARYNAFAKFSRDMTSSIPDTGTPANMYAYNSHAGQYLRNLDEARFHLEEMRDAFYGEPIPHATEPAEQK